LRQRSPIRDALEYAAAVLVLGSLERGPRPVAEWLARRYVSLLDLAVPRLRGTAMRNLELAMPELPVEERRRITSGVFKSIARLLVAFARLPRINGENVAEWIRYEGYEHFEEALRRGRGVLIATGHLGNWELSAFAQAILSAPMCVVVRPLDNPRLDALVARRRALSGNRLIEKKDFARGLLQALAANQAVGILVDQNTSLEEGVFADFFGIPASSNSGFARIAEHSGAAVIAGFALWSDEERKYVLRFYPPLEITGDAARDTQALQKQVEAVVRQYPEQWLWIHRRWKTRPPGAASLY
jgi:Kdo2-lipid IVA lauroyltransferase/acyltransferase